MTRGARQAALRILLLQEEFSPQEIADALSLLGSVEKEDLVAFLQRTASERAGRKDAQRRPANLEGQHTRALQALRRRSPEKYEVLLPFEEAIRRGEVLPTLNDLRAFGRSLSKTFNVGKSRKDALSRLIELLADMDIEAIKLASSRAASSSESPGAFQRLADHLISGRIDRS